MTEIAPLALPDIVAASRLFALREAVVAGLKALLPDVEVKSHPGKIDLSDVVAGDVFSTPSVVVALTRVKGDPRLSGSEDVVAAITAYVIVENMEIAGKLVTADEVGPALCEAIVHFLERPTGEARWGLDDIGLPEDVEAQPVFTAKTFARGAAFYAATWKQEIYATGVAMFGGGTEDV